MRGNIRTFLSWVATALSAIVMIGTCSQTANGQSPLYYKLWNSPEVQQRIQMGIETNRMGWLTLNFVDAQGKPLNHVQVDLKQITHDFKFGSDIFYLNGSSSPEINRRYKEAFVSLFNFATAPFYWSDLEPKPGVLRFGINSPFVARRPPPDAVVAFCKKHGIAIKGHNLIWHAWYPKWLPKNQAQVTELMRERFRQIASRYGKSIRYWDVVNEPLHRPINVILPKDYVYTAMQEAGRDFPADDTLMVNETTSLWTDFHWEESPFYLLVQSLLLRKARIDALGLQFHIFSWQKYKDLLAGTFMTPEQLFRVIDQYSRLGLPLLISEITIPTLSTPQGEEEQATVVRNLYRLWFSCRNMEAITWWNLADGTAYPRENRWKGGLLHKDMSPKPSFHVLYDLIHKQWSTSVQRNSGNSSEMMIHGFYGEFSLTASHAGKTVTETIHLRKTGEGVSDSVNHFTIEFH